MAGLSSISGGSVLVVATVVIIAVCAGGIIGGISEIVCAFAVLTFTVFTPFGWIGSVEPCGGAGAAAGWASGVTATSLADAVCTSAGFAAGLDGSLLICAMASSLGALRCSAATRMYLEIRSRMRASRQLAVRPPNTAATMWRPPRRTDVTRLKPEALV